MKKTFLGLTTLLLLIVPGLSGAMTDDQIEDRKEIAQVWVDRHNAKLDPVVIQAVKGLKAKKHSQLLSSFHRGLVPLKHLSLRTASEYKVPSSVPLAHNDDVPLVALYQSKADGFSFLTADYADEQDPLHSSSDIYVKVGLLYRPLFHGEGIAASARVMRLGKGLPLFFEVVTYGGGGLCEKTIYTLKPGALDTMTQDVYDHPDRIDTKDYILEVLKLNVWLEGFTLYKDVDKDGVLEIVNSTDVVYPDDLKATVKDKYNLTDNDFAGAFRKTVTVYKWDDAKAQFKDLGDFFY